MKIKKQQLFQTKPTPPLAVHLRPKSLLEIIGQQHLVDEGKPLRLMVESGRARSTLLWGPPGAGKTTIARVIANDSKCFFYNLDATKSGVKELRTIIEEACDGWEREQKRTLVFLDEIHRWTKAQQDVLLPAVEEGLLILFGATTENPKFAVNSTILSRVLVYEVKPLSNTDMVIVTQRVFAHYEQTTSKSLRFSDKHVGSVLIKRCSGDARKLITALEMIVEVLLRGDAVTITAEMVDAAIPDKHLVFDASGNDHYDMAHAVQEAVQHSDADGAIYWLAKWLASGEDPAYICRRLLITAYEDCADNPHVITSVVGACLVVERTGPPECYIPMAHAVITMAQSRRCKIAYYALKEALADVMNGTTISVPPELRAGTSGYPFAITKRYVSGDISNYLRDMEPS